MPWKNASLVLHNPIDKGFEEVLKEENGGNVIDMMRRTPSESRQKLYSSTAEVINKLESKLPFTSLIPNQEILSEDEKSLPIKKRKRRYLKFLREASIATMVEANEKAKSVTLEKKSCNGKINKATKNRSRNMRRRKQGKIIWSYVCHSFTSQHLTKKWPINDIAGVCNTSKELENEEGTKQEHREQEIEEGEIIEME